MINVSEKKIKPFLIILNQLFDMENKVQKIKEPNSIKRNMDRIKEIMATEIFPDGQGLIYHNPIGEKYDETRIDCEANISGLGNDNLEIIEVIKPIIFYKLGDSQIIVQKAVVIVQSKNIG
jgi:hypothetical protein